MVLTASQKASLGNAAPDFCLKGVDGKMHSLSEVKGEKGLVVMFICNHCPYVLAIKSLLSKYGKEIQDLGVGVVAISANDAESYPDDSYENMIEFSKKNRFTFPYLYDESQEVAKAYGAMCTPDIFGYNADLKLQYRGQLDRTRPSKPAPEGSPKDLVEAMRLIAETGEGPAEQTPSIGCSIKWK